MKTVQYVAFFLASSVAGHLFAQTITGKVQQIDPVANTLIVAGLKGSYRTFHVTDMTTITLNGKRATLDALTAGTLVMVTPGELDSAGTIVSPPPAGEIKPVPPESHITILATANMVSPVKVGMVTAGQTITVLPQNVRWCGGGSRKGVYTDWRGYEQGGKGIPWMALVAAVGDKTYWAQNNTLSFVAPTDGLLILYANDNKPEDNTGQADLIVTVTAKQAH
jgi:hypothetical protein